MLDHLRAHLPERAVREVRGRGLMIGMELRGKVAPVLKDLQARGVLALPAGRTVLRLLPPAGDFGRRSVAGGVHRRGGSEPCL